MWVTSRTFKMLEILSVQCAFKAPVIHFMYALERNYYQKLLNLHKILDRRFNTISALYISMIVVYENQLTNFKNSFVRLNYQIEDEKNNIDPYI